MAFHWVSRESFGTVHLLDYDHFLTILIQFINRPRIAGCGTGHFMASNVRMLMNY